MGGSDGRDSPYLVQAPGAPRRVALALLFVFVCLTLIFALAVAAARYDASLPSLLVLVLSGPIALISIELSLNLLIFAAGPMNAYRHGETINDSSHFELNSNSPVVGVIPVIVPLLLRAEEDAKFALSVVEENISFSGIGNCSFIILVDFADALSAQLATDEELRLTLEQGVGILNAQFSAPNRNVVFTMYRRRTFNTFDKRWMGWERKRGKLVEFLRCTRGFETSFDSLIPEQFKDVPYVVTIDADTRLSCSGAEALVRVLRHVRNNDRGDTKPALLAPALNTYERPAESVFRWVSEPNLYGHDLDWNSPSAVQMWFGRDIFHGKGAIAVDDFLEKSTDVPANTVLSHDHLESVLGGCQSTCDVSVAEPFPATRADWEKRQHRWTRGDVQVLPWILGRKLDRLRVPLPSSRRLVLVYIVVTALNPVLVYSGMVLATTGAPGLAFAVIGMSAGFDRGGLFSSWLQCFRFMSRRVAAGRLRHAVLFFSVNGLLRSAGSLMYAQRNAIVAMDAAGVAAMRMAKGKTGLIEWYPDNRHEPLRRLRIIEVVLVSLALAIAIGSGGESWAITLCAIVIFGALVPLAVSLLPLITRRPFSSGAKGGAYRL